MLVYSPTNSHGTQKTGGRQTGCPLQIMFFGVHLKLRGESPFPLRPANKLRFLLSPNWDFEQTSTNRVPRALVLMPKKESGLRKAGGGFPSNMSNPCVTNSPSHKQVQISALCIYMMLGRAPYQVLMAIQLGCSFRFSPLDHG